MSEKKAYGRRLLQRGHTDEEADLLLDSVFESGAVEVRVAEWSGFQLQPEYSESGKEGGVVLERERACKNPSERRIPLGEVGYVVSLVKRGRQTRRELHFLGRRHLVPGVDYLKYEWLVREARS